MGLSSRQQLRSRRITPLGCLCDEIPSLATAWLKEVRERVGRGPTALDQESAVLLAALPWRGGLTEFRFVLERLAVKVERPVVRFEDVLDVIEVAPGVRSDPGENLHDATRRFEREFIGSVLERHNGEVTKAARALGLHRPNLYRKLRALGLRPRRDARRPD